MEEPLVGTFRAPLHLSAPRWFEVSEMQPHLHHQHVSNHVVQQGGQESVFIVLQTLAVVVSQGQVSATGGGLEVLRQLGEHKHTL